MIQSRVERGHWSEVDGVQQWLIEGYGTAVREGALESLSHIHKGTQSPTVPAVHVSCNACAL